MSHTKNKYLSSVCIKYLKRDILFLNHEIINIYYLKLDKTIVTF